MSTSPRTAVLHVGVVGARRFGAAHHSGGNNPGMRTETNVRPPLPPLPIDKWEATKDTLHLWAQIVGKVRMASSPPRNHWWHATLYLDTRGLTTRRMHSDDGVTFQIDFDFVDHRLLVRTAAGAAESFALHDGLTVAAFDDELHGTLRDSGSTSTSGSCRLASR